MAGALQLSNGVSVDFIVNGKPIGDVAKMLDRVQGDIGQLRPWCEESGSRSLITTNMMYEPKHQENMFVNADTPMSYDQWQQVDKSVMGVFQQELTLTNKIEQNYGKLDIDGMATPIMTWQRRSRLTGAEISMDGRKRSDNDGHDFDTQSLPIVIFHKDADNPVRDVQVSKRGGATGIDTYWIEDATYEVTLAIEETVAGSRTFSYQGFPMHGLTNFAPRNTQVLTAPDGTNNALVVTEIGQMIDKLDDDGFSGPYDIWFSSNYRPWMIKDFSTAKGDNTLLDRIKDIPGIETIQMDRRFNNSTKYVIVITHRGRRTGRIVQGLAGRPRVIRALSHMGFEEHYKVIAMKQLQLWSDKEGNNGVCHGSTA